jgi:eukaryotic-like serine/threonine-protein kinase
VSDTIPERPRQYAVLPAGKSIGGRYLIESVIGDGAHAVVYLARRERPPALSAEEDSVDEAPASDKVALKVIHRHLCGDPQIYQRFHREAAILTRLHGEHVVKLFDFIEEDGLLTIALEHVEGMSLEARLRKAPLALGEAVEITLQICAALGAAHAAGIIHRDLKPANVLVTEQRRMPSASGSSPSALHAASAPAEPTTEIRVKVVDFGLARLVHGDKEMTSLTEQGMIFGSPEYMAPEQARGDEADARSDLYAAGVMLFEMAVGEPPFKGRSAIAAMTAHVSEAPPSPRSLRSDGRISVALEAIILRALAKDPADRYPSARAFAEAIASADKQPLVIRAPRGVDIDLLGAGDTDLNLAPPSLATARTIPTMEVSLETREQLARARAEVRPVLPTLPDTPSPAPAPGASIVPRPSSATAIPDTLLSPVYEPPARSRWLWVLVAIVAATVGVILGAIAGTR